MSDTLQRALKTALQGFVGTVVTLWGAAGVFSQQGAIDTSAAKRFLAAVVSAAIASGISLAMSVVFSGGAPAPAVPPPAAAQP